MNKQLDGLYLYEIVLLFLGIFLFVVLVMVLVFFVIKHRPIKSLVLFFPIPIVMIGFPGIQNFQLGKDLLYVERAKRQIAENPSDSATKAELDKRLKSLESRPITDPDFLREIAEGEAAVGDSVKALEMTEKIIQNNPPSEDTKRLWERLATPTVKLEQGISKVSENPENEKTREKLADQLKKFENSSVQLSPYAIYQTARAHLALGDTTKAISQLDSVIKDKPDNQWAKNLKKNLSIRTQ